MYQLLQIEQYWQTNLIQCCMIKKEKTHLLIDIAIPDDSNINTKETEKLSKYKDLENEVSWKQRMEQVINKMCSACYALRNIKHSVSRHTKGNPFRSHTLYHKLWYNFLG